MGYVSLAIQLMSALVTMVGERWLQFVLILSVLAVYTVPVGFVMLRRLVSRKFSAYCTLVLSFALGLVVLVPVSLWSLFVSFDYRLIALGQAAVLLVFLLWKRKPLALPQNSVSEMPLWVKVVCGALLFLYYVLVPLTTDYAHFRDYALLALGIEENSASLLPVYDIQIYYPPGSSLVTALVHQWLPWVEPVVIMITLAHLLAFVIVLLVYLVGREGADSEPLGFFFAATYMVGAVSRNFVTGGATIPSLFATVFGLFFLIVVLWYVRSLRQKPAFFLLLMAGVALGSAAISHVDTLLTFLWGFGSMVLVMLVMYPKWRRSVMVLFAIVGVVSFVLASPFLLRSYAFKAELDDRWTDEAWEAYTKDEIHPKPLWEIMHYVGPLFFLLGVLGAIVFVVGGRRLRWLDDVQWVLVGGVVCWFVFILLSNSFVFLRIMRPFILFYAINIILWHGISIPLSFAGGFFFFTLYTKCRGKTWVLAGALLLAVISIMDYETVNVQNVFARQGGFLLLPFADRAGYVNLGDIDVFRKLAQLPAGLVLNYPNPAGDETIVYSGQPSFTYFTHEFYDNVTQHRWLDQRRRRAENFFMTGNNSLLREENISYIFLPSEISAGESYAPELLLNYAVLYRAGGAKLLSPERAKIPLLHVEVENVTSAPTHHYFYDNTLSVRVIQLRKNERVHVALPSSSILTQSLGNTTGVNKTVRIFIKHLSFVSPLAFDVIIGNTTVPIRKVTNKLTFTESVIEVSWSDVLSSGITLVGRSDGIDFFKFRTYVPEVDWIEMELPDQTFVRV